MFSKRSTCSRSWAVLLVAWSAGFAGCTTLSNLGAGLRSLPSRQPVATRQPIPVRKPLPSERVTRPVETSQRAKSTSQISSVAEFLARTSEYQRAAAPSMYESKLPPVDSPPRGLRREPYGQAANTSRMAGLSDRADRELRDAVLADSDIATPVRAAPRLAVPIVRAVTVSLSATPTKAVLARPILQTAPNTANQPLSVAESKPNWTPDSVLKKLEHDSSESGDLDSVWPLKFAQLAFHRDELAAEMPATLSAETRSVLGALMRLAPEIRRVARDAATPGDEALNRVDELRQILADRSDPAVSTIALCRKVVTYGVYDELDASALVAGRENQAIVYSEIRNLRAEKTEAGMFRSRLATRLEVLTSDGKSVWQHEEPDIVDESRTRRSDFFLAERIALPSILPAGEYVLKVMVQDKISQRMHESLKPFSIVSAVPISDLTTSLPIP